MWQHRGSSRENVQPRSSRECHSPSLVRSGSSENSCVRCTGWMICSDWWQSCETVETLRSIREAEQEIEWWSQALSSLRQKRKHTAENTQVQRDPVSSLYQAQDSSIIKRSGGKSILGTAGELPPCVPCPPKCPYPYNRYEALDVGGQSMEDVDRSPSTPELSPMSEGPSPYVMTTSMRKKRWIIVVGCYLQRETVSPIRQADSPHREVCCLAGAQVKDITTKLPSLVQPSDYYLLLILTVGGE